MSLDSIRRCPPIGITRICGLDITSQELKSQSRLKKQNNKGCCEVAAINGVNALGLTRGGADRGACFHELSPPQGGTCFAHGSRRRNRPPRQASSSRISVGGFWPSRFALGSTPRLPVILMFRLRALAQPVPVRAESISMPLRIQFVRSGHFPYGRDAISDKERRNVSAVVHETTMNRGLPLRIGFSWTWANTFRPSLSLQSLKALESIPRSSLWLD